MAEFMLMTRKIGDADDSPTVVRPVARSSFLLVWQPLGWEEAPEGAMATPSVLDVDNRDPQGNATPSSDQAAYIAEQYAKLHPTEDTQSPPLQAPPGTDPVTASTPQPEQPPQDPGQPEPPHGGPQSAPQATPLDKPAAETAVGRSKQQSS